MRQANPRSLAPHETGYSSPDNKTTDPWPAIAAAIPRYARDAPAKSPPPPTPPKSKSSTKPAAYTDNLDAPPELPEVQSPHPPFHPFRRFPLFCETQKLLCCCRRLHFAQFRKLLRQRVKFLQQFLVSDIFGVRFFRYEGERSARLEHALPYFGKCIEPLFACGRGQLFLGDQFTFEFVLMNFSVFDQNVGAAFDDLLQLAMIVQKSYDEIIDG